MKYVGFLILVLTLASCKERYEVTLPPAETSFLVVEGFINTNGVTQVKLSRTTSLGDRDIQFEENAVIAIEADDNTAYPLVESDSGRYLSETLQLDPARSYRLDIRTANSNRYYSAFEKPIITPPLELSWQRYNEGVEIYVNTQDQLNNTTYYRWEYDETWEIHSDYGNRMKVFEDRSPTGEINYHYGYRDSVLFLSLDTLYYCWRTRSSSAIKVGSTERLTEARVLSPIIYYPRQSEEMAVLYSVLVKQYGLTKDGYEFFGKIKKNTESLGTIFDAQPSEIRGNIRNVADDDELIIGYIPVTSVTERRLFIHNNELADWNYFSGCPLQFTYVKQMRDSILYYNYYNNMLPTDPVFADDGTLLGALAAEPPCVDCRLRGTNIKPTFWP